MKTKKKPTAESIIAAVRSHGNDARSLRDAAHEAHHALSARVPRGRWDRETIHACLRNSFNNAEFRADELMARAVEQIVCSDLGVDPGGDIDRWAFISCLESVKYGYPLGDPSDVARAIKMFMKTPAARIAADNVLNLTAFKPRKPRVVQQ